MVKYGPNIENLNMIHDKAAGKKDGVYTFRGVTYRVKGGKFTHFAYRGEVVEQYGNFSAVIGKYERYRERNALKLP